MITPTTYIITFNSNHQTPYSHTGLFLHLDRLYSCCPCTGVPGEEISVYDPTTDKRFIIKDGELVEPPEDDVETGDTPSSSSYGFPAQEPKASSDIIWKSFLVLLLKFDCLFVLFL